MQLENPGALSIADLFTPNVPFLILTFPTNLVKKRASPLLMMKRVLFVGFLRGLA